MIKIVTWNVNSVNARLDRVLAFLEREQPDYLCLQELKCPDEKFPFQAIESKGYISTVFGQKSYNGVAILSKLNVNVIARNFIDASSDMSARFIAVDTGSIKILNAYVPNGQSIDSEKYPYKLDWLSRASAYLRGNLKPSERIVIVGDFNIAPDDRDVYDPIAWKNHIHCTQPERQALGELVSFGFVDTLRMFHQEKDLFSWWDYREGSFGLNKGLRIDLIYATPSLAMTCKSVRIDRDERKGEKPSDHAPVIANFSV